MLWRWVVIAFVVTLLEPTRANRLEELSLDFDELSEPGSAAIPSEEEEEEDLHLFPEEDVLILTEEAPLVRPGTKGAGFGWWKRADGTSVAEEASKRASWGRRRRRFWRSIARTGGRIFKGIKKTVYKALCPTRARLEPQIVALKGRLRQSIIYTLPYDYKRLRREEARMAARRIRTSWLFRYFTARIGIREKSVKYGQDQLARKKAEIGKGACGVLIALVRKVQQFIISNLCNIVKIGIAAAAAVADAGIQFLATAYSGGTLGPVIIALRSQPWCQIPGFSKNSSKVATGIARRVFEAGKVYSQSRKAGSMANKVRGVAGQSLCKVGKKAGPMSGGNIKTATRNIMNWNSCDVKQFTTQMVAFGLHILCGNFVQALTTLLQPLILCRLKINGAVCQNTGCFF